MKRTFFTADQHFAHANIIKFCNRPWKTVQEMNRALIENHNSVVQAGDDVYHLGDFAFRDHQNFLQHLNGNHFLIKGNHEGNDWRKAAFSWTKEVAMIRVQDGDESQDIFLSHYGHRTWNRNNRDSSCQ